MKKILLPAVGCSVPTCALSSPKIRFLTRASIVVWLSLAICLQLAASNSNGQGLDSEITLELKHTTLKEALRLLQNKTNIPMVYAPGLVEAYTDVNLSRERRTVRAILGIILKGTDISYVERDNAIVLRIKAKAELRTNKDAHSDISPPLLTVGGKVTDATTLEPLAGVNIIIKGTTRGTNTDSNGEFSIDAESNETLMISFISYKTLEVLVGSQTRIDIALENDATTLQEVQVIGTDYYSVSKEKSTMNIEKVTSKDIQDQPVTNIMNSLVGRVAGLDIVPPNGAAGLAPMIQIRGNNSFRLDGSYPLYVIDGVQIESSPLNSSSLSTSQTGFDPLGSINPADIESIEVLKDAAATAIYGSRGANGVIRVTTKQNKNAGRTNFNVNLYSGIGEVANHVDLLSRRQYIDMRKEAYRNDGEPVSDYDYSAGGSAVWDTTRYTDWQKELLGGKSKITDLQFGFSGGTGRTSFRFSGGFHKESVIYSDDFGYKRGTANFSLHHTSKDDKFNAVISANFGTSKNLLFEDANFVGLALSLAPNAPSLYDADGNLNWQEYEVFPGFNFHSWNNPLSSLQKTDEYRSRNWTTNTSLSYEIIDGLSVKANIGFNEISSTQTIKLPVAASAPYTRPYIEGESRFGTNNRSSTLVEPQLSYAKSFSLHSLNVVIGTTYRQSLSAYQSLKGTGYKSDDLLGTPSAAGQTQYLSDYSNEYKYAAVFARIGYDYNGKYLLDISGRRDGSSRFGPGKRFGNFGAVGIGWIFTKENLLQNMPVFSFGKIRASYGVTGNDQIGDYIYYNSYKVVTTKYQNVLGIIPKSLLNPDYAWERTAKTEVALELGFAEDRITLQTAWYRNSSSNQLVDYPLPATAGFSSIKRNFNAEIENTGLEILFNSLNISKEHFKWSTAVNFTFPRNKLVSFDNIEDSPYNAQLKVGEPLSIQRYYTYKGVDPTTGNYLIQDTDGDGFITDADRDFMLPIVKQFFGGITNTVSLHRFELSFLFQFVKGNSNNWLPLPAPGSDSRNYGTYILDRWRQEGDNSKWGKFSNESTFKSTYQDQVYFSDFNVTDASFIRLKTISFAYKLPGTVLDKLKIQECRIYFQGQNLFTSTKYVGLDPETKDSLPPLRMMSLGIQVNL